MSAIRISRPGQPTRLVDLGPDVARVHDWRAQRKTIDDDRGLPMPWLRGLRPGGTSVEGVR